MSKKLSPALTEADSIKYSNSFMIGLTLIAALAFFFDRLNGTIAVTAIPDIAKSLASSPEGITTAMACYMLSLAVFIPLGGFLAKKFGSKNVFLAAIGVFSLGGILCGISGSLETFILAQIFQGAGGACMVPTSRLFILKNSSKKQLSTIMVILVWPGLVAPVIGPILGAWLTTHFTWHSIYFINIPIGIILASLVFFIYQKIDKNELDSANFDWIGFILVGMSSLLIILFLHLFATSGFNSILPYLVVLACIVSFFSFLRHIKKTEKPIFQLTSFENRGFSVSQFSNLVTRMSIGAMPILLPLFLESQLHMSLIETGSMLLILAAGSFIAQPTSKLIYTRLGFKVPLLIALVIAALTTISFLFFSHIFYLLAIMLFISGATRAILFTGFGMLSFADLPKKDINDGNVITNLLGIVASAIATVLISLFLGIGNQHSSGIHHILPLLSFQIAFITLTVILIIPFLFILFKLKTTDGNAIRITK